ncbi:MAG: carbamoyltransferase HypF, partial [Elusimicrobiota bacterium]
AGFLDFSIKPSEGALSASAWVLPDLATCPECLVEIADKEARRYAYPFTNCTLCGPRFTIITAIPYDRPNTTMAGFKLCDECQMEYADPRDRRFHAQPIACPKCGPKIWLDPAPSPAPNGPMEVLYQAAQKIRSGEIVALKGIGGFLLLCDARSSAAVSRLRARKRRHEKPLAVMFPDLEQLRDACQVSKLEAEWLDSAVAPIVLLKRRPDPAGDLIAAEVAPGNPWLGAMLPYAPLHHLLMGQLGFPVVATSGNLSEEPIVYQNDEAKKCLQGIADCFLMHDRPIARHADDSIVRQARGRQLVLRRARGLAPMPLRVNPKLLPVLALGAHLKNTVAAAWDKQIVLSQHLGDLETAASLEAFQAAVKDLCALYGFKPKKVVCDLHPDYASSRHAESLGLPIVRVQHHHAHIAACMAENDAPPPVLGVAWDGLGLGTDGLVWGGEFLIVDETGAKRFAHMRTFPLPGGEAAIREPRRCSLGLLFEMNADLERLHAMFPEGWEAARKLPAALALSPRTSSAGRLFDALASLVGLRQANSFEGQAAMALEHVIDESAGDEAYPFPLKPGSSLIADWEPLVRAALADVSGGVPVGRISARFHNALAELVVSVARRANLERVALSGGVFQNAYLSSRTAELLERSGFQVFTHQRLPPNDGGISAGQAFIAGQDWAC